MCLHCVGSRKTDVASADPKYSASVEHTLVKYAVKRGKTVQGTCVELKTTAIAPGAADLRQSHAPQAASRKRHCAVGGAHDHLSGVGSCRPGHIDLCAWLHNQIS